jgi:SAM-dependent methyltransferase
MNESIAAAEPSIAETPSFRAAPSRCPLCGASGAVSTAGFRQIYPQHQSSAILLDWWECRACAGWFVAPVPSQEAIARYWPTVVWQSSALKDDVADSKRQLYRNVVSYLTRHLGTGRLLDIGSNFGGFLGEARSSGWDAVGLEPNQEAVAFSRAQGFEIHEGWSLQPLLEAQQRFDAIVAIDVFCYSHNPLEDLAAYAALLRNGGVLAMRLTNKRRLLGWARRLVPRGAKRDALLSRGLQAQFHAIELAPLQKILREIGFTASKVVPGARTGSWGDYSLSGRACYLAAHGLRAITLGRINVSPGVLLFAHKGDA